MSQLHESAVVWEGEPLYISNSEIQMFKDDRRSWWLAYYRELGLRREHQDIVSAKDLGTRVHNALYELYTKNANPITVLDDQYAEAIEFLKSVPNGDDRTIDLKKEQDLAHAMIEGFMDWREQEQIDVGLKLVAAESIVIVHSAVKGVFLRGKLDQRWIRKIDGARLFRDWKTVGSISEPAKILPIDEQMKFYHMLEYLEAMEKNNNQPPKWRTDGALYTMLRKVKRTGSAKPPFYGQLEVHSNMAELRSMYLRTQKVVEEIVVTRQALDAGGDHRYWCPPRPNRDLTWKSDFFPVYGLFDDGSNAEGLLEEYYEHVDPHRRYLDGDETNTNVK